MERRSGHIVRDHLLCQQIVGFDVVTRDGADEILEAHVDQHLYPLDSLARRCRHQGLLHGGEERLGKLIQLRLDGRRGLGQDQRAEQR